VRWLIIAPVVFYQRCIGPMLPAACRYYPSCSNYMLEAVRLHGAVRGAWLGLRRLARCHPWGGYGYDPVPPPHGADTAGQRNRPSSS
jgi:putative membrane protein insertion efficiency factor